MSRHDANAPSGQSGDELLARAVAALVREWGVTEEQAREAIEAVQRRERRLGPIARRQWVA